MGFTESNGTPFTMPVMPMNGYGGMGMGNGFGFGNEGWWLLVILFAMWGGWGRNGMGGSGGGDIPYIINNGLNADVQRGFDQQAVISGINGVSNAINGVQQSICNGFAGAEASASARQMADMQQMFTLQSQLAQCCCDDQLATAGLNATILAEGCSTRQAISDGFRDVTSGSYQNTTAILQAINGGIQSIQDTLCQDKIDAKNEKIADLQRQLTMAQFKESQNLQTAALLTDNTAQTVALENYLAPPVRPAYIVANPNGCCSANYGFGYGGCGGYSSCG